MVRFMPRSLLGVLVASLTAAALVALPASSSASAHFKTGTYLGKTSQHATIKFKLHDVTGCTGKTASKMTYCLGETVQANVELKCPDGSTSHSYLDISGSLSAAGVLKVTYAGDEHIFADLKLTPGGKLTGYTTVKQPETANPKPVCSSGKIGITAKLV
jgi:hypothetical protein